jgi:hypothetical protein
MVGKKKSQRNDIEAARVLGSPLGRETDQGAIPGALNEDEVRRPTGAKRRSDVTGKHDVGVGANETPDGLSARDESVRRQAEDVPLAPEPEDEDEAAELEQEGSPQDPPVFDQAGKPPRT